MLKNENAVMSYPSKAIQRFYLSNGASSLPEISHGEGIYLWDTNGARYIDASSGPVVNNIGHANRRVIAAMTRQAERVAYASRAHFENAPNRELAEKVTALAGDGFDQAYVVSGGSEAIEAAIKLAKQYAEAIGQPDRSIVLARNPSYHGATLGAAAVTGDAMSRKLFADLMNPQPLVPAPFTYRIPDNFSPESYARHCAQAIADEVERVGGDKVLAFLMEPVGGLATGALVAPDIYYSEVRKICDRYGILLIFDEVMSGAGRTGAFLAAHHWPDCRPDIVVLAKGVAAGYTPLGIVLAPDRIVEPVVNGGGFSHGHTYAANPLSCAVASEVISVLEEDELIANAEAVGRHLKAGLWGVAEECPIIGDVRGKGLLMAVELVQDQETKSIFPADANVIGRTVAIGMQEGLALYARRTSGGVFGEWLMISPPLITSRSQAEELCDRLGRTLKRVSEEMVSYL
ncbi:aminotransferase class III-fold pyridoxal phosphate-dependent enzyme [Roseovarius sp.]|uniref:aminotransferase family protein n=1 Tax=Roseovarius sp. TaxID=1486281 RepID=UPI00262E90BC|nr:aminotransferase class III-fold pyridoxal phosphate-dependent enzyme [Roseovarius sp.]MDM8165602.1 aminotransferase class III-fold pyridoxal phosphate-dependent enzyme [Roseovarius sp.]